MGRYSKLIQNIKKKSCNNILPVQRGQLKKSFIILKNNIFYAFLFFIDFVKHQSIKFYNLISLFDDILL